MQIKTIDELTEKYKKYLSKDEIILVQTYYAYTNNFNNAILICEDLKKAAYGLAHGKADKKAINAVNQKIATDVILKLINKSEDFFNRLPLDIQDELIECYDEYSVEEELKKNVYKILELFLPDSTEVHTAETENEIEEIPELPEEIKIPQRNNVIPETKTSNTKEFPSILAKLKYYQKKIAESKKEE